MIIVYHCYTSFSLLPLREDSLIEVGLYEINLIRIEFHLLLVCRGENEPLITRI